MEGRPPGNAGRIVHFTVGTDKSGEDIFSGFHYNQKRNQWFFTPPKQESVYP